MNRTNPRLLFITSSMWLSNGLQGMASLFEMRNAFSLISTSAQLSYLLENIFPHNLLELEILKEDPSPEEISLIKNDNPEFYSQYNIFSSNWEATLSYAIPSDDPVLIEKSHQRIENKTPPLFNEHNLADIISWITFLSDTNIPQESDLYIYDKPNNQEFFYQKSINPYLSYEWKYFKRGFIYAYDPSMFNKRTLVQQDFNPQATKRKQPSSEFLRARFIVVLDEAKQKLLVPLSSDHKEIESLLKEAKDCILNFENKGGTLETLKSMKRLFNETLHKYQNSKKK